MLTGIYSICRSILLSAIILASASVNDLSQTGEETRGLRPREYAQKISSSVTQKRPRAGRAARASAARYAPLTSDNSLMAEGVDIGVTIWQLRPARKPDNPAVVEQTRIVKRVKGKQVESVEKMTAVRAKSEAPLADGDMFRLSIEVPFESYVYVLDQEQYSDGSLSDAYLIYPGHTDSRATPGKLLFVPSEPYYFEVSGSNPEGKERVAEVFTVILMRKPIERLPPLNEGEELRKVDRQLFDELQQRWASKVWKFESVGGSGVSITKAEKSAATNKGGRLTTDDPPPQTIYHVARKSEDGLMFNIPVKVAK